MKAELKRLIQNLGELAALADDIERLKSVEQAEAEAQARIAAVQREADAIVAKATNTLTEANTLAEAKVQEAEAEADKIKAAAKMHGDKAVEKAERTAAELVRQADAKFTAAVQQQEAAAQTVAEIESRRETLAGELAALEQRLAEVRALLAPLAG